jgi:hypothetical protein
MNTSPIKTLKLKTEIYKPNLPNLQVYGNIAYIHIPKENKMTLEVWKLIWVGYYNSQRLVDVI